MGNPADLQNTPHFLSDAPSLPLAPNKTCPSPKRKALGGGSSAVDVEARCSPRQCRAHPPVQRAGLRWADRLSRCSPPAGPPARQHAGPVTAVYPLKVQGMSLERCPMRCMSTPSLCTTKPCLTAHNAPYHVQLMCLKVHSNARIPEAPQQPKGSTAGCLHKSRKGGSSGRPAFCWALGGKAAGAWSMRNSVSPRRPHARASYPYSTARAVTWAQPHPV